MAYKRKQRRPGYIYIVWAAEYQWAKIGITSKGRERLKTYDTVVPFETMTRHFLVENMAEQEEAWHKRFESQRIRGEWFHLRIGDVNEFLNRNGIAPEPGE